ncbi:MAG TPA: barstar family protein [Micromonosporaceae bacterium]
MTGRLTTILSGGRPPGVYRWLSRAHPSAVRRELAAVGWGLHALDGRAVTDARSLFDRCAQALSFPGWFGHDWDALAHCLGDLSWLPGAGHMLLWERYGVLARADAKAWRLAYQVMVDATAARRESGADPLFVLLRGPGPTHTPDGSAAIPAT